MARVKRSGAACATPGCAQLLTHTQTYLRLRRCDQCRARRWLGFSVQSDELWGLRARITRKANKRFYLRCAAGGCSKEWAWSNSRRDKEHCAKHAQSKGRLPHYARFMQMVNRAKKRGIPLLLAYDDYASIVSQQQCIYCGGKTSSTGAGVDRVDPSRGYVPGNVVACCSACNSKKSFRKSAKDMLGGAPQPAWWPCDSYEKSAAQIEMIAAVDFTKRKPIIS